MKIKLIALFIMMRSLAAIADNDTYFFSKVDYGSVFVVQTADGFLYQIILIGRIFFPVWGGETEAKIGCFADGNWQE